MRTFTPEETQRYTSQDLVALRQDFPDAVWADEFAAILTELHDLAGLPDRDLVQLERLQQRAAALFREHKLKGLDPILWMIASLKSESNVASQ